MARRTVNPKLGQVAAKLADDPDPLRPPTVTDPDGDAYRSPLVAHPATTTPVTKEGQLTTRGEVTAPDPAVPLEPTLPPPPPPKGRR